jgi:hypothetical protein
VRASKAEAGAGTGTTTAIFPAPSPGGAAPSIESGDIDAAPQAPAGPDIEADIEAELKKRQ